MSKYVVTFSRRGQFIADAIEFAASAPDAVNQALRRWPNLAGLDDETTLFQPASGSLLTDFEALTAPPVEEPIQSVSMIPPWAVESWAGKPTG